MPAMSKQNDHLIPWAPPGLSLLLVELSRLALELQNQVLPTCKPDGSLVTPADTRLEELLTVFLLENDPHCFVIGEETLAQRGVDYLTAAMAGRTWVLDPIDGTALYALGIEGWGISIGLMQAGVLLEGVVAYPKRAVTGASLEVVFSSGHSVLTAETALTADNTVVLEQLELVRHDLRVLPLIAGYPGQISTSQRFAKGGSYRGKHPIICFGSSVLTFRLLMGGALAGYLVKLKLWDLAAVWPMAWRLGFRCAMSDGTALDLKVSPKAWHTDPADPQFLALRDHILFYHPDRLDPAVWRDFSLPAV